jgi:hypothetical protein
LDQTFAGVALFSTAQEAGPVAEQLQRADRGVAIWEKLTS